MQVLLYILIYKITMLSQLWVGNTWYIPNGLKKKKNLPFLFLSHFIPYHFYWVTGKYCFINYRQKRRHKLTGFPDTREPESGSKLCDLYTQWTVALTLGGWWALWGAPSDHFLCSHCEFEINITASLSMAGLAPCSASPSLTTEIRGRKWCTHSPLESVQCQNPVPLLKPTRRDGCLRRTAGQKETVITNSF